MLHIYSKYVYVYYHNHNRFLILVILENENYKKTTRSAMLYEILSASELDIEINKLDWQLVFFFFK